MTANVGRDPLDEAFRRVRDRDLSLQEQLRTLAETQRRERPEFAAAVDRLVTRLWFANLVLYSVVLTLADSYVSFTDIGSAVMKMLADTRGIKIKIWIGEEMKKIMRHRSDRDIAKFQGSDSWMLPIPATFIVGRCTLR